MLNTAVEVFSGLRCQIVDGLKPGTAATKLVVLSHGFGAPGDDLVGLAAFLIRASETVAATCRFVFPAAPIDLTPMGMPGGRAWWPINMAKLAEINQTGDYDELTKLLPDGMLTASEQLLNALREIQAQSGLNDSATVLGGFSQGAMLSTDVVLRHGVHPRHLVLFSGTVLCSAEWQQFAAEHPGCPVLQSHGRQDPVLPFPPAESLRDLLGRNGFDVKFRPFDGPHTIPEQVLLDLARLLSY
ncbi:MAG: phospholipase [Fuerstiella sp.]